MGMYTKLHCNIKIKKDASNCIKIIKYMLNNSIYDIEELNLDENHLFETDRWHFMLNHCSFYFTGTNNTKLIETNYDYVLHCDCDFKNYENEIDLFLKWIVKYCDYDYREFIGYKRYEEDSEPTLLYFDNGKLIEKYILETKEVEE